MTKNEFLNQFNVLYNNTTSNQAPNLNEYEISVFLTKGEYEVLKNYFNPKSNKLGEGFDDSPKRHVDFSSLTKEITLSSSLRLVAPGSPPGIITALLFIISKSNNLSALISTP